MGFLSGLFDKGKTADVKSSSKEDSNSRSNSKTSESAETAFSEALAAKSGTDAVKALENAQPEELKAIAKDKTLMEQMPACLDAKSCEKCNELLGTKKSSSSSSDKWYNKLLNSAQDLFSSGKEVVSNVIDSGKEFVSNIVESGKEAYSSIKNYFQNLDIEQTGNDIYQNTIAKMPDSSRHSTLTGVYNAVSLLSMPGMRKKSKENKENNAKAFGYDEKTQTYSMDPATFGMTTATTADDGTVDTSLAGYIEDQNADAWQGVNYGITNMGNAGCGIIATYNALRSLDEVGVDPEPETIMKIIARYEESGSVIGGMIGTAPNAVLDYFLETGHDAKMTTDFSVQNLASMAKEYDTFLCVGLLFKSNGNISSGHWLSITTQTDSETKDVSYIIHNGYGTEPHASLKDAIDNINGSRSSDPLSLIGVKHLSSSQVATTADAGGNSAVATTEGKNNSNLGKEALNGLVDFGKAFVPSFVSNDTVVGAFDFMRNLDTSALASKLGDGKVGTFIKEKILGNISNTMTEEEIAAHKAQNEIDLAGLGEKGYIENQAQWGNIAFGKGLSNMSYSGCEIIATYNALYSMGENPSMPELIAMYEKDGMTRNGQFGTAPKAIYEYFASKYSAEMITDFSSDSKLDDVGKKYATFIATVYNDSSDITAMIHTVSITKTNDGGRDVFAVHNTYTKSNGKYVEKGGYKTLKEAIAAISESTTPKTEEDVDNPKGETITISTVKPISLIAINK